MEMLNNIWTALSIPNSTLISYILIPFGFIESSLSLMLFVNLLNIKCSTKDKLLYVFLSSTCSIINHTLVPSPFNVIFNYLIVFTIIYFIFRQGILKTVIAMFLPSLVLALIDALILNVYITILHISYEQAANIPIYRAFYLLIVYTIACFIIFILKHKNMKIKVLEIFDKKTKRIVILNFIVGLLTVILQGVIIVYYIDFANLFVTFLNFIVLLAYFCINLYSLNKITKLTITTRELETAEAYN